MGSLLLNSIDHALLVLLIRHDNLGFQLLRLLQQNVTAMALQTVRVRQEQFEVVLPDQLRVEDMLQQPNLTSLHELPVRSVVVPLTEVLDGGWSLRRSGHRFFLGLLRPLLLLSLLLPVRLLLPTIVCGKYPLLLGRLLYGRLFHSRFRRRGVCSIRLFPTPCSSTSCVLLLHLPSLLVAFLLEPVILLHISALPHNNLQDVF